MPSPKLYSTNTLQNIPIVFFFNYYPRFSDGYREDLVPPPPLHLPSIQRRDLVPPSTTSSLYTEERFSAPSTTSSLYTGERFSAPSALHLPSIQGRDLVPPSTTSSLYTGERFSAPQHYIFPLYRGEI